MSAVIPGRFQPFHRGHLHAIQQAEKQHDTVVVAVNNRGTYGERDDPLPGETRKHLITACLPDILVIALPGAPGDDDWHRALAGSIDIDTVITGEDAVGDAFADDIAVEEPAALRPDYYSGARIRERVRNGQEWAHLVPEQVAGILQQTGSIAFIAND